MKILILQKNLELAKEWKIAWKREGYLVDLAGNYEEALSFFYQGEYQLVVLDTWIKGGDIFQFASKVRERNPKVVFFFLSENSSEEMKKRAFEVGADLFLNHNTSMEEKKWYLKAWERRMTMQEEYQKQSLEWKNIKVNLLERKVYQEGKELDFTSKEFSIFVFLLKNKGFVLHRDILKKELCGEETEINSNLIDSYIKNIRKKIKDEKKEWIKTVRGYGYGMEEEKVGE